MWRVDKDPHLSSTFGTVSVLDRPPDFDALRARMERATWAVPRLRWRVQPAPVEPVGADVGRRPRLRHRQPRPAHRAAQAGLDAPAVRPRHAARQRHVRPDAAAVAVHRRSRACAAARRRWCRRCTTRSPTARAACRCRCSSSTSSATPHRRRRSTSWPADITPPPPSPTAAESMRDLMAGGVPPAARRRPARCSELLVDPTAIPAAERGDRRHRPRRPVPAVGRRAGPLAAVDRALVAPPLRGRAGAVPGHQGRGRSASAARSTRRS